MDRNEFATVISAYAAVQPRGAPNFNEKNVIWYWFEEFKNYSIDSIKKALRRHIAKSSFFPSISELHSSLGDGQISNETMAQITSMSIISAIRRYGWCNESDALKYVGELGEKVVRFLGGWSAVCEMVTDENLTYFSHSLKQTCESVLKSNGSCLPELPVGNEEIVKQLAAEIDRRSTSERVRNPETNLKLAFDKRIQSLEKLPGTDDDKGRLLW
jgi:hypothetical protein